MRWKERQVGYATKHFAFVPLWLEDTQEWVWLETVWKILVRIDVDGDYCPYRVYEYRSSIEKEVKP